MNIKEFILIEGDDYAFANRRRGAFIPFGTAGDCSSPAKECIRVN